METLPTNVQTIDLREPIPGYVLGERLGSGGFGEVWRAEAPGGLAKAVKIVYGPMQGDRAGQELKALQRIKEVRHPMLLSLERIESVAEHLVIVMELADGSLRDRQGEREAAGLPGIPREELLTYLRDAADAMDYLVEHHSLLHLDIKPENLLLVADRVKVADFGLMRELNDNSASLAGGMTPLYAAPEVFDGRPHRLSDQYSLAIVYQELLTGQPPFAGRTAAQLISQHLHSQPNLTALPAFDRPVIARALSKLADRRFPNCRALIEALTRSRRTADRSASRRSPTDAAPHGDNWRGTGGTTTFGTEAVAQTDLVSLAFPFSTEVHNLPPIALDGTATGARPTLFVGVGGMGTRVLCRLKQFLSQQFGNVEETPAWQFLALETDPQTLSQSSAEASEGGLRFHESLLLPLQEPQDYRTKSSALLEWMNRRWLYNIPRSKKTEGIRALGRLAFVDHFGTIVDALHGTLSMALARESIQATSRRTGLRFCTSAPRIFVVGSTTGGTGGGMMLDLGYTLRTLLKKMEIADDHLAGILMCATPLRAKARDLAIANTVALLGELRQFSEERYPGEPACDLPPFEAAAPFTNSYFVHQGNVADEAALQRAVDDISTYLLLNTSSRAAPFFDGCRDKPAAPADGGPSCIRSFGLSRSNCQANNLTAVAAKSLAGSLFARWTEFSGEARQLRPGSREGTEERSQALASQFSEMFGLHELQVVDAAMTLIEEELGQSVRQYMRKTLNDIWVQSAHMNLDARVSMAVESVDRLVGASRQESNAAHTKSLSAILDQKLLVRSHQTQAAMQEWLAKLVDSPGLRVAGARYACAWLTRHFERLDRAAVEQLDDWKSETDRLKASFKEAEAGGQSETPEHVLVGVSSRTFQGLLEYATTMLHAASYRRTLRVWQSLREVVLSSERRLRGLSASLETLAAEAPDSNQRGPADPRMSKSLASQLSSLQGQWPQLVSALDRELERMHLGQLLILDDTVHQGEIDLENLARVTEKQAKTVLRRHLREAPTSDVEKQETYDTDRFRECVNLALPEVASNGGAKRVLVTVPVDAEVDPATLGGDRRLADESSTVVTDGEGKVTVCYELEQIPIENLAVSLIRNRADYLDLAARLHTRIDVQWQPFAPASTVVEPASPA